MENFNNEVAVVSAREFFNLLDAYLIKDLEVMVGEIPSRQVGGLGYPAIHSIVAGMELLGLLTSGGGKGQKAFDYFWSNYLVKKFPNYTNLNKIFYKVIRHGTAHLFLVKSGISISKSGSNNLGVNGAGGKSMLNVDLKEIFGNFKSCYDEIKTTLLTIKNEGALKQFWAGFNNLLEQMRRAQNDVADYLSSRGQEVSSSKPIVIHNVSASNILSSCESKNYLITRPPEHWLKAPKDDPSQDGLNIGKGEFLEKP